MNITKLVRTVTFKVINKILTINKDNTKTKWCFISTMVNHIFQWRTIVKLLQSKLPQIILKCSTDIMMLIHSQPFDAQHKVMQAINLTLVHNFHQFPLLHSHALRPHKKQYKGDGRVSVMKGFDRQKKQRN